MRIPQLKQLLHRMHRCERGDIPVGPIMIIGLIVIPLIIGLIVFRENLTSWMQTQWETFTGADATDDGLKPDGP